MCGLAGFLSSHNNLSDPHTIIATMTDRVAHRGPDGSGIWCSPQNDLALGHRRLAIIDLSAGGHQPMHSQNERYVMEIGRAHV